MTTGEETLLAIDIGNSSISMGIFVGRRLLQKFKMPTHPEKKGIFYEKKIRSFLLGNYIETPVKGAAIASVVPQLSKIFQEVARDLSIRKPLTVSFSKNIGLDFAVEKPAEVGADRIANAVAAIEIIGIPVLIVDFGTATTISAVKERKFIGGAILPGLGLMGNALGIGTSKLPLIDFGSLKAEIATISAVGKSTTKNIISGIIYGTAGAFERLVKEMNAAEGCHFKIVTTGGYSGIIDRFLRIRHRREPDLTLKGLQLIYERNI